MRLALAGFVALGCGCKSILGIESGVVGEREDARTDDANDADTIDSVIDVPPPDARTCFGTFQQICLDETPEPELHITALTTIDSLLFQCSETQTIGGVDLCIVSAEQITVDAGAQLATAGLRFVVLVASEKITIAGTLDSWSAGSTTCPTAQGGVGGGGAGGSFGALGGVGGGAQGTPPSAAATTITTFRRGCRGDEGGSDAQGGDGGLGGSGIFLVAPSIQLTSTARINASGYGGSGGNNDRGGGGGGSGGLVVLDAETLAIDTGAVVIATGGGGGGGGGGGMAPSGTRATTGSPTSPGQGAPGNAAASGDGGDGGLQAAGDMGEPGVNGRGGGGGGGGTGVILVTAPSPTISGTVIPTQRAPF
ncbi:MAG: hypothetical protein AB7T06_06900 [Kofleriaceae bacterium]